MVGDRGVQCNCNKWWRYVVPTNDGSIFHRACNHPGTHDGIDTNPNAYNDIMNSETLSGCQGYAINYLNSANGHYLGGSNYFNYCIGGQVAALRRTALASATQTTEGEGEENNKMLKKTMIMLAVAGSAVLSAFVAMFFAAGTVTKIAQAQFYVVDPWTVTLHHSDDQNSNIYDYVLARRGNGDEVQKDLLPNGRREITRRSAGIIQVLEPTGHYVTTLGSGKAMPLSSFGNKCEAVPGITSESKMIQGFATFKAVKSDTTNTPDGAMVETTEMWVAPSLNCQWLYSKYVATVQGKHDVLTEETAISAIAGEPDPALFDVPASAKEVPPSVFMPAIGRQSNPRQEDAYNKQKAARAAIGKP
jgi:hypothetical protein